MTVLVSSFPFDKVLKVKFCKLIISRINKKGSINVIIFSPQGNVHRTRQANINSSVVSRLSRVSNLSSLTSSISMISNPNPNHNPNFNINIDRMIEAPGHGKDIVDAINSCDK